MTTTTTTTQQQASSPETLTFFFASFFKMKSLSNLIIKTKLKGIMFDSDFILKMMQKKSEHFRETEGKVEKRKKEKHSHTQTHTTCRLELDSGFFFIY